MYKELINTINEEIYNISLLDDETKEELVFLAMDTQKEIIEKNMRTKKRMAFVQYMYDAHYLVEVGIAIADFTELLVLVEESEEANIA